MSDAVLVTRPLSPFQSWTPAWRLVGGLPGRLSGRVPARTVAAAAILALSLMLLAVGATALVRLRDGGTAVPALPPPLPPEWTDVPRPVHIFDLEAPMLRGLPPLYSARRRTMGDGREDMLAYGTPGHDAALRLRLGRRGPGAAALPPLVAAIASQAADADLSVGRVGLADLMPTRFGRFEVADVTLVDQTALRVPCSGFRLALDAPAFTISGLACGTPGKPLTRAALACLVDRLDLASGGEDRAMIDFFAASERRRDPSCVGARLAPDGMHAAWLDDKPVTRAKTSRRH